MEKLTKLDKDISYVSSLSDYPNSNDGLTSTQLKETFDKGNNDIKDFINTTLTEEIDSKFATVPDTYATKEELANVQAGQIIDGTITYEKLSEDVQNKVKEADKVKPIYKYHKLENLTVTKTDEGKYINNFTFSELVENPDENLKFSVQFPNADEKQGGTDYYTAEGYKISANNIQDYEHGIDKAFDKKANTSCILTSSDMIILTLPQAKTFTKVKTFITADNLGNIIYKGSNDKEIWTNLGVVSEVDTELAEHTFSLSGEYLYYGIEVNLIEGTASINDIQFEEDENMPSDWILGTGFGMITTNNISNYLNGMNISLPVEANKRYDFIVENNEITEKEDFLIYHKPTVEKVAEDLTQWNYEDGSIKEYEETFENKYYLELSNGNFLEYSGSGIGAVVVLYDSSNNVLKNVTVMQDLTDNIRNVTAFEIDNKIIIACNQYVTDTTDRNLYYQVYDLNMNLLKASTLLGTYTSNTTSANSGLKITFCQYKEKQFAIACSAIIKVSASTYYNAYVYVIDTDTYEVVYNYDFRGMAPKMFKSSNTDELVVIACQSTITEPRSLILNPTLGTVVQAITTISSKDCYTGEVHLCPLSNGGYGVLYVEANGNLQTWCTFLNSKGVVTKEYLDVSGNNSTLTSGPNILVYDKSHFAMAYKSGDIFYFKLIKLGTNSKTELLSTSVAGMVMRKYPLTEKNLIAFAESNQAYTPERYRTNKFEIEENLEGKVDNRVVLINTQEDLDTTTVNYNKLNNIDVDTLLQPDKYYELVYKEADDKFYAKEVRV